MKEDADVKARRRRSARGTFPAPLNQISLRYVDAVQSLNGERKAILANVINQLGMSYLGSCLVVLRSSGSSIKTETDLITALRQSDNTGGTNSQDNNLDLPIDAPAIEEIDTDYLASLLAKCYPDMPQAAADALVGSEVMAPSLQVVSTTRYALSEARSDFVITALYTLFEEKLDQIEQVIAQNPAFIKAMQLSRPDWKSN